jgi:hypothetical protein
MNAIRRQHIVQNFFDEAESLRDALDDRFKDAYRQKICWQYFCDPGKYTYLRAPAEDALQRDIFERFMVRLGNWCMESLGLVPVSTPNLHLMVNGCRLGLHSDFHNGAWGYVYSLTRWERRRFSGGETLLLRDGVPSYKRHHVHGEVLYETVPAHFNQLLIFDDRIVHATPAIEGGMDPLDGRIALVGHIRAASPMVVGSLDPEDARRVVLHAWGQLRDRIRSYKDVQGTITYRLVVDASGTVEAAKVLTDNIVTQLNGYDRSEAVLAVKAIVQQTLKGLRFPAALGRSSVTVPILIPLPDLEPIEIQIPHDSSPDATREWMAVHLTDERGLELRGEWRGNTLAVREPIAGSIRIEPKQIVMSFDPPMWVASQRESFQESLSEWAGPACSS